MDASQSFPLLNLPNELCLSIVRYASQDTPAVRSACVRLSALSVRAFEEHNRVLRPLVQGSVPDLSPHESYKSMLDRLNADACALKCEHEILCQQEWNFKNAERLGKSVSKKRKFWEGYSRVVMSGNLARQAGSNLSEFENRDGTIDFERAWKWVKTTPIAQLETLHVRQDLYLSDMVSDLTALRELTIDQNTVLQRLPDLTSLTNLTKLFLSEIPHLYELSPTLTLNTLRKLKLYKCDMLRELPSLNALRKLYISKCVKLRSLSPLPHLQVLSLSETPKLMNISSLAISKDLRVLYITSYALTVIPQVVFELEKLEELKLEDLGLREISDDLGRLNLLRILKLSNNNLVGLPITIGKLENLVRLEAKNNILDKLPPTTAGMTRLKELDLDNNQFTHVPGELQKCPNITEINLRNNRLTNLTFPRFLSLMSSTGLLRLHGNQGISYDVATVPFFSKEYVAQDEHSS